MSPRDLPRYGDQDRARAPGELLDELRLRLDRLASGHPSSSSHDLPDQGPGEYAHEGESAGAREAADAADDQEPDRDLPDSPAAGSDVPGGNAPPDAGRPGGPASAAPDGGSGRLMAGRPGRGDPYRPWFMTGDTAAPWFAAGEDL